jgi:Zn-dependent protease with chaperone function
MHLILLLGILSLAWGLRCTESAAVTSWAERWQQALTLFLLPPLLLVTSAIAVLWMGPHGQMVWSWEGWLSYGIAICFLGFTGVRLLHLTWEGYRTLQQVRAQPIVELMGKTIRVINASTLYSAQIGFWQPELVMSQGLLETLERDHIEAVLAHEQAHCYYRDTFYFFWLGWIRHVTAWLPQTEAIWQELLVLRELRADRWASMQTDALLLAEALLLVVGQSPRFDETICAAFSSITPPSRLAQRIEALLTEVEPTHQTHLGIEHWLWLFFAVLPLVAIPFHY